MATYRTIQAYVHARYGYTPKTCWIAHVKELVGLPITHAPNRHGIEHVHPYPPYRREHIIEAMTHFGMLVVPDNVESLMTRGDVATKQQSMTPYIAVRGNIPARTMY